MEEKYLVINAGSSSLKFSLYEMPSETEIARGLIENVGNPKESSIKLFLLDCTEPIKAKVSAFNHEAALNIAEDMLIKAGSISSPDEIKSISHRVVHGGTTYDAPAIIDEAVIEHIEKYTIFAPNHHPGALACIKASQKKWLSAIQFADFDTSFHTTMPTFNKNYAIDLNFAKNTGIYRAGFHGNSCEYLVDRITKLGYPNPNMIVCHIGSGASVTAILDGKSFDTSMGVTPSVGIPMSTRVGDFDFAALPIISAITGQNVDDIINYLNKRSGLFAVAGICGTTNFKEILAAKDNGSAEAQLAYDMLVEGILGYLGKYYFKMGGRISHIVFTAGIGENCDQLVKDVIKGLPPQIGVVLDDKVNKENDVKSFTIPDSAFKVLAIPTNEEIMMARHAYDIVKEMNKSR